MRAVDFNSDLGESYGLWERGADAALMEVISSANVACGFHAGDPSIMRDCVEAAVAHGIRTTAGTVSAAAFVMVAVFSMFVTLSATDMKQFGFGLAAAILIDATIDGKPRKLVSTAARNGYFYTLDRITGKNIVTSKYGSTTNWALGLRKTGEVDPDPAKEATIPGSLVSPATASAPVSAATSSSGSLRLPVTQTPYPSAPRRRAIAAPIPVPPPVTSAARLMPRRLCSP